MDFIADGDLVPLEMRENILEELWGSTEVCGG